MSTIGRPSPYPRRLVASACLSAHGSVRLVARQHCVYRVEQQSQRAVVWCRPISADALAWMRLRGVDAERVVCERAEVDGWIARQEGAIHATRRPVLGNVVPAPARLVRPPASAIVLPESTRGRSP